MASLVICCSSGLFKEEKWRVVVDFLAAGISAVEARRHVGKARWSLKDSFVDVESGKIRDTSVLMGEYDDAHDRNVPKVDTTTVLLAKRLQRDLSKIVMKSKRRTVLWTETFLGFFPLDFSKAFGSQFYNPHN